MSDIHTTIFDDERYGSVCKRCGFEFIDTSSDGRVVCRECREREQQEGDDG